MKKILLSGGTIVRNNSQPEVSGQCRNGQRFTSSRADISRFRPTYCLFWTNG
jgi:hypothetical protein